MRQWIGYGLAIVASATVAGVAVAALAAEKPTPAMVAPSTMMVRLAVIGIDPARIDAYKAILREEQAASVRLEPGVLMLHSVQLAGDPTQVRLLEVYASRAAYEAHIRSPHFLKYKTATETMVTSLELLPTAPILLCAKSRGRAGGPVTCM